MQQQHLILYFTDGCHLCDDAVELLQQTIIPFKKVDIVYQQKLVDLYGCSIPVLQKKNGDTLNWPFDLQQIIDFSDNNSTD
jgi:hypothetical protein